MQGNERAFAPFEGDFDRVGEASPDAVLDHQTIHDDLDIVHFLGVESGAGVFGEIGDRAIDPGADEPFAGEAIQDVPELAFEGVDHGGEDHQACSRGQGEDAVDDVAGGLSADGFAGIRAVLLAGVGVEQSEEVEDLGGGGDGGAWIGRGRALFDGDGGERPSMKSTSGRCKWSRNCRA
jgi:hypothetical protein